MFVPSLPWQNVRFHIYMAQKCRFSQGTAALPTVLLEAGGYGCVLRSDDGSAPPAEFMEEMAVRQKTPFRSHLYFKMIRVTNTGSGQTWGKRCKREMMRFLQALAVNPLSSFDPTW
jgi:hypothetical protein